MSIRILCEFKEMVKVKDLKPYPNNPNVHPAKQIEELAFVIKNDAWRVPIIVSNRSGCIVAGHGRLAAAKLLDMTEVPVDRQDFESDELEYAFVVADNGLSEWSEIDRAMVNEKMPDLGPDFDIRMLGLENFTLDVSEQRDGDEKKLGALAERFLVPPFSVFDTKQGYWQDRKGYWLAMGIKSELGRGGAC